MKDTPTMETLADKVRDSKKLKRIMQKDKPALTATIELISPEIAAEMLKKNVGHNRDLYDRHVLWLAEQMRAGKWLQTHQGIAFDKKGNLVDGQHRLTAVIRSMTAQWFLVVRGVDENTFVVHDTGKPRNAKDVLVSEGFKEYPNYLASATKLCLTLQRQAYGQIEGSRKMAMITNWDILDFVQKNHTLLRESVAHYHTMAARHGYIFPISHAVALVYTASRIKGCDTNTALEFFDLIYSGINLGENDPAFYLRNWSFKMKSADLKVTTKQRLALLIKGWNYWRNGVEPGKMWSHKSGDDFPVME